MSLDPRKIDITNKGDLEKLLFEIEGAYNKDRKAEAWKLFECYEDNQRPHVMEQLAALYPDTHQKFRIGDVNICGKILGKKSQAYKTSPTRALKNDKETKAYVNILEESKADRAFREFDKLFNAHKYTPMWVNYINPKGDETEGKYMFSALAPYEYDLLKNPLTGEAMIFILHYPDTTITGGQDGVEQAIMESQKDTSAESKIYSIWSNTHKVKVKRTINSQGETLDAKIEIVETMPNDIERLPIAFLSKDLAVDYPLPSQLANKSIDWNVGLSDLKTAASAQGHGQLIIKHPTGQSIQSPHLGKHTAIMLPQSKKENDKPTEAMYINASPDLAGQLEVLKFDLINILDDEGIQAKSSLEGGVDKFTSGFDRLLSEADTQNIIEGNQSLYADIEDECYKIVRAYEESLNKNTFTTDSLTIIYDKPKVMISDKETLENIRTRDELGLILPHEKHLIINPNLSEKEAQKRELDIQEYKKQKLKEMSEVMEGEEPEEDDEDEEVINNDE